MNFKKLDQLVKKVEDYNEGNAFYTYRKGEHYICDNNGTTMYYYDTEMAASSLKELLGLGETTYKAGQLFKLGSDIFLLAQVSFCKYCLIDVKMGNRMNESIFVKDCHAITEEELAKMYSKANELKAIDSLKDAYLKGYMNGCITQNTYSSSF